MRRDPVLLRKVFAVTYSAVTVTVSLILMGRGTLNAWPDYVHTTYGFPFIWGVHVTTTFVGRVDFWMIDTTALLFDLLFWEAVVVAFPLALLLLSSKPRTHHGVSQGQGSHHGPKPRLDLNKDRS
ncbi:MAG: hypothetical protein NZ988_04990 [Thaumarchaeota archaeon]|nr:hypothetical protein [Candidatus Calditenuaceae archaeon]MDW8187381.1 hypothetical protein [Nitrososphaerota archaeon]